MKNSKDTLHICSCQQGIQTMNRNSLHNLSKAHMQECWIIRIWGTHSEGRKPSLQPSRQNNAGASEHCVPPPVKNCWCSLRHRSITASRKTLCSAVGGCELFLNSVNHKYVADTWPQCHFFTQMIKMWFSTRNTRGQERWQEQLNFVPAHNLSLPISSWLICAPNLFSSR